MMMSKTEDELKAYVFINGFINDKKTSYQKIKFVKAFGYVDFAFKNPNTLANQRKVKVNELEAENKALKKEIKEWERYYKLIHQDKKLTSKQADFVNEFTTSKQDLLK